MPRKNTIRTNQFPYHITSRSNNKEWYALAMPKVWSIAKDSLKLAHTKFPIKLHAFVMMSNHYHMVVETPDANIDQFMYEFNKNFSLQMRKATGQINKMFGGRYKWSIVEDERYYLNVMKYVFSNPLRANMVKDIRQYPYSTLVERIVGIPIVERRKWCESGWPDWLNEGFNEQQQKSIKSGFRFQNFKFANISTLKRPPEFTIPKI